MAKIWDYFTRQVIISNKIWVVNKNPSVSAHKLPPNYQLFSIQNTALPYLREACYCFFPSSFGFLLAGSIGFKELPELTDPSEDVLE